MSPFALFLLSAPRWRAAEQNCSRPTIRCAQTCEAKNGQYIAESLRQCRMCRCRECDVCIAAWEDGLVPWAPMPSEKMEAIGRSTQHSGIHNTGIVRRAAKGAVKKGKSGQKHKNIKKNGAQKWRDVEGVVMNGTKPRRHIKEGSKSKAVALNGPQWRDLYNKTVSGSLDTVEGMSGKKWRMNKLKTHNAFIRDGANITRKRDRDANVARIRSSKWEASKRAAEELERKWVARGEFVAVILLILGALALLPVVFSFMRSSSEDGSEICGRDYGYSTVDLDFDDEDDLDATAPLQGKR